MLLKLSEPKTTTLLSDASAGAAALAGSGLAAFGASLPVEDAMKDLKDGISLPP